LALAVSLEDLALKNDNANAKLLATALDKATEKLLNNGKSPLRRAGQLDNRGSHFYLAMYWAEAMAAQTENADLAAKFAELAKQLSENEEKIVAEIDATQGNPMDIGGYYMPDEDKVSAAMAPSATLRGALASL
jgi:isocitrate dehydrogenase